MKKPLAYTLPLLLCLLAACTKTPDTPNPNPTNQTAQDSAKAMQTLATLYEQNLPDWGGSWGSVAELSDESYGDSRLLEGTLLPNDIDDFGTGPDNPKLFGKIRNLNSFISDVSKTKLSAETQNRLKAQAFFFRAWRFFDLVRLYGGVPLVKSLETSAGVEVSGQTLLARNSTSETFIQIKSDLDSALAFLPIRWSNAADRGRITKGAAAALAGRAALYAASPQFNPNDVQARWQTAYTANKQAYELLTANGYGLHPSFDQLWFQADNNPEAVLITTFGASGMVHKANAYDNATRPAYMGTGGGANQPSWEMVKAFPMLDGKRPAEAGKYTYSDTLFFKNRDPRFDKTIAYNGAAWPLNANNTYKLWTYTANGASVESKPTRTGFYTRKAISPTLSANSVQTSTADWIEIRMAEVMLNLAETACGTNRLDEAYTLLKAIRKRAGIEAGADGQYGLKSGLSRTDLFDAVLYERQIELAFEGKRFWDLRRWKLMERTLNGKRRTGLAINLKPTGVPANFAAIRDTLNLETAYRRYFTLAPVILDSKYAIAWRPEYYYFAIPPSAIALNNKLIQNTAWGGTFNPLQ